MNISKSALRLNERQASLKSLRSRSLSARFKQVDLESSQKEQANTDKSVSTHEDVVELSAGTRKSLEVSSTETPDAADKTSHDKTQSTSETASTEASSSTLELGSRIETFSAVLKETTGSEVEVLDPEEVQRAKEQQGDTKEKLKNLLEEKRNSSAPRKWGVNVEKKVQTVQTSQTSLSATGTIETKDGKTAKFELNVEVSQTRVRVRQFELDSNSVELLDPLVLNFDGTASKLADEETAEKLQRQSGDSEKQAVIQSDKELPAIGGPDSQSISEVLETFDEFYDKFQDVVESVTSEAESASNRDYEELKTQSVEQTERKPRHVQEQKPDIQSEKSQNSDEVTPDSLGQTGTFGETTNNSSNSEADITDLDFSQ